ncbi:unnamed protein product [Closterium sp. Naga37s-1]|nr:unnamed protein product [Closterium sp. Naga37s-1]
MPHMNLLYPFWEDNADNFHRAAEIMRTALAGTEPFEVHLASFNVFHHGKSCTVWLQPTPSPPLIALQRTLEAAFPECNDLSQIVADGFCPHLSVGQWRTRKDAEAAISSFQEKWTPITFQLNFVSLISRQGYHDPFLVQVQVPLDHSGGGVLVGKVDALQHAGVLQRAVAEGAGDDGEPPLFVWAEKGRLQPCDEFHSEDVVAWVTRKSGRSVAALDPASPSDLPSLDSLLDDSVTALALALVHDTQGTAAAEFRGASKDVEGVRFALTTHAAVATALGWQGDAAAALARAGAEGGVVAVLKSRNDTFSQFKGELARKAVAEFVHGNRLPLFVHMGDAAAEEFGKNTKWHIVIFCPRTDYPHFEESLTPLARQHVGKVFFMVVDSSDEDTSGQPMDYFGIHEGETAVLAVLSYTEEGEHHETKHRLAGEPTLSNMQEFITAFLAGELPPYYKSDPVPDQNDGVVRTVVGSTFKEIVMDDSKDVMLMLSFSDECPSCDDLLPHFTHLAERLSDRPALLFAAMDYASNEVPGLELEAFPTVMLYPAGRKSDPVAVEDRLVRWKHMVRTLRQHAGTALHLPENLEEEVEEQGEEYEKQRRKEAAAEQARREAGEVKDEL